jgi:hypothetical protein
LAKSPKGLDRTQWFPGLVSQQFSSFSQLKGEVSREAVGATGVQWGRTPPKVCLSYGRASSLASMAVLCQTSPVMMARMFHAGSRGKVSTPPFNSALPEPMQKVPAVIVELGGASSMGRAVKAQALPRMPPGPLRHQAALSSSGYPSATSFTCTRCISLHL